jgi:hypothetical protein
MIRMMRVYATVLLTSLLLMASATISASAQEQPARSDDSRQVMEVFNQQALEEAKSNELSDEEKHKILFFMGLGLLILICATAYLGVSMVVFNKEVFVPHMITAGLTVTLGLAHAVAAVVWFFPF